MKSADRPDGGAPPEASPTQPPAPDGGDDVDRWIWRTAAALPSAERLERMWRTIAAGMTAPEPPAPPREDEA